MWEHYCQKEKTIMSVGDGEPCNWCGKEHTMAGEHDKMIKESVNASEIQVGGSHYKDCVIQPIDYIVKNKLDFLEGNVVKYITRHKTKGQEEDIRKVIHYCELILEHTYGKWK